MQSDELSLATRAAWLSYVGKHTQEEIAGRLGVSRIKVNRLIGQAVRAGLVHVFVEGTAAEVSTCMQGTTIVVTAITAVK